MTAQPNYLCPICHAKLQKEDRQLRCDKNHSFDYAKEGYVNLLPVQNKKSLNPGDDKNMVMARRAFLTAGHYDFLREALTNNLQALSLQVVVDLGCGEGYYTNHFAQCLPLASIYGIDISKSAVKYAAKRNDKVHYSVGTNAALPFSTHSIDAIVNVFAPLVPAECFRILNDEGIIVRVSPGPRHLWQLKEYVYPTPQLHEAPQDLAGFQVKQRIEVKSTQTVDNVNLAPLLQMTPFGWKIKTEQLARLNELTSLDIEFDFLIDLLHKNVQQA